MTMRGVKFEDLTQEQQFQAFQSWKTKVEGRKSTTQAKRAALRKLVDLHKAEYENLIKSETARLGAKANEPASDDDEDDETPVGAGATSARGRK